ncbi:MAG TPA: DUF6438 domain-containing protein [Phycisphaerae bacterium]|nr:DUF6438 domain-containing protein [Phycisphaerae bacterium]
MSPHIRALPLLSLLLFSACATTPSSTPQHILISLERTRCFGTCPAYKVTIDEHGTVTFVGTYRATAPGPHLTSIPPAAVRSLLTQARSLGFWSMQSKYTAAITDLPTTITTITIDNQTKSVEDYFNAPEALHKLETLIDQTANTAQWIAPSYSRGL